MSDKALNKVQEQPMLGRGMHLGELNIIVGTCTGKSEMVKRMILDMALKTSKQMVFLDGKISFDYDGPGDGTIEKMIREGKIKNFKEKKAMTVMGDIRKALKDGNNLIVIDSCTALPENEKTNEN